FFSSRRRHTRFSRDWSSDVCSSDLCDIPRQKGQRPGEERSPSPGAARISGSVQAVAAPKSRADVLTDVVEELVDLVDLLHALDRSEERRVGKEGRPGCPLSRQNDKQ